MVGHNHSKTKLSKTLLNMAMAVREIVLKSLSTDFGALPLLGSEPSLIVM